MAEFTILLVYLLSSVLFAVCLVRHRFVNEAYDNMDSMGMTPTTHNSDYAQPIANGTHPPAQPRPGQEPVAYLTGINSTLYAACGLTHLIVTVIYYVNQVTKHNKCLLFL